MTDSAAPPPSANSAERPARSWTIYVDMDAYYVSCELRERPELRGKPVIVGPDPGKGPTRGVVLSASYEARALGVRGAMPAGRAAKLCPDAIWLPADFRKYGHMAKEIRAKLEAPARRVIPLSIDEAAVEVTAGSVEEVDRLAHEIQDTLWNELQLPASIGVSIDRTIAKIATDRAKPRGVVVVPPDGAAAFLAPLPVEAIPGVGPRTAERLHGVGVTTIESLTTVPSLALRRAVGAWAPSLVALARGTPRPRSTEEDDRGPRTRSTARTFAHDIGELAEAQKSLAYLCEELSGELDRERLRFQTVAVSARWADFERTQRNRTFPAAHEDAATLAGSARRLMEEIWTLESRGKRRGIRTLSIGVERLSPRRQRQQLLEGFGAPSATKAISEDPVPPDDAE